jgi:hypothetical protein
MKTKLILCALFLSAGTLLLNAQPPRQHNRDGNGQGQGQGQNREMVTPEARADRMAQHLELTDAQKAKVLELFKQEAVKMNALKEEVKGLRQKNEKVSEEQKAKFEALRKSQYAELEKIIGKEKIAKLQSNSTDKKQKMHKMEKMHAEMHNRMNMHQQPNRPMQPQMGNQMHQQGPKMGRMENIKEKFTPVRRAEYLKTELGLTDAEKDALVQLFDAEQKKIAEERKQKMEAAKKSHDAEVEKIIGKDKMAKYKELQKAKMDKVQKIRKVKQV